jgi:hypothetical protein
MPPCGAHLLLNRGLVNRRRRRRLLLLLVLLLVRRRRNGRGLVQRRRGMRRVALRTAARTHLEVGTWNTRASGTHAPQAHTAGVT